ncbi:hypothetical protein K7X08_024108 [Anisodus acutangulus]|uniref:Uncharacterized protein n=1 Tax=Anisodus acutangulus TaxID=402998 RepID=A0A9Q1REN9_9SOLA|nr:hypothetical protein K7X08_024108 [Anisodus acutangulus]
MTSESKTANAIGGKTARACDSCLSKRARWFCPADDAFLCQSCDVSVHSANQLASRHERVRLETSSNKSSTDVKLVDQTHQPAWHQGFTRKARTPRNGKKSIQIGQWKKDVENWVPEIGSEENSPDENEYENEEQLLYRVPVFDPFEAELCTVPAETATITNLDILLNSTEDTCDDLNLHEFISSDIELAEFAADVESLLGEEFRVVEEDDQQTVEYTKAIKIEVEDEEMRAVVACHLDPELDMAREALNWNFNEYEETVEEKVMATAAVTEFVHSGSSSKSDEKRRLILRLNHEAVISAWPNQSSPWTNGIRPHFNCWPDFLETCMGEGGGGHQGYEGHVRSGDGGREARVSRYREKRRTRLFSKKIRYQVRKLNAEKRPRLKGRFVKRTSFSAPGFPNLMNKR